MELELDAAALEELEPGALLRPGASWMLVLMQTILPTCTVLVDRKLGVVEVKVKPPLPVPSACVNGVQLTLLTGTPRASIKYRVETAARAVWLT